MGKPARMIGVRVIGVPLLLDMSAQEAVAAWASWLPESSQRDSVGQVGPIRHMLPLPGPHSQKSEDELEPTFLQF